MLTVWDDNDCVVLERKDEDAGHLENAVQALLDPVELAYESLSILKA